jgi:hypothetical protein
VSDRRFGSVLSLLRQGLSVGSQFGAHSLEALLSVAETIEESVYERGSLTWTSNGFTFRLNNPPLRTGAFSSLGLTIDGARVSTGRVRVGGHPDLPWREVTDISRERPLELRPGDRIEVAVDRPTREGVRELTVRLEFQSIAIPPLVWLEFTDTLAREDGA